MSGTASAALAQAGRLLRIASPLGEDALILRRLDVREAIGEPFLIAAEVVSATDDLAPAALVGKAVTCTVEPPGQEPRHFHGIVRAFGRVGSFGRGLTAYRFQAVPRLWAMSRTSDCRIFQAQTVKAIATKLLGEAAVAPVTFGTLPSAPRPYCVQWNESDLGFLDRILGEVGGGYFFKYDAADHTLCVTGANADFPLIPGEPLTVRAEHGGPDALFDWHAQAAQRPGKVVAQDFDGLRPKTANLLKAEAATVLDTAGGAAWERFHWPGGQFGIPDADPAKLEMETAEGHAAEVSCNGALAAVFAGGRLKVKPSLEAAEATWLVSAAEHSAVDETQMSGGGGATYANRLTLIPAERTWRNPSPPPRPLVPGLQSALVTGPAGEEIHCDEFGRIKVHFLWDREGPMDDTSTCWVRVAQPWAGAWGGAWFLPRIGDEVLIGFLHGDPDHPVCIGSLYNQDSKPLYGLPANKTRSWIATRSSKNGAAATANILRFEDKKGSEELYVHAEKDMNTIVEDNRDAKIQKGNDSTTVEKGNRAVTVSTGDLSTEVSKGNEDRKVAMGNRSTEISMGNETLAVKMGNIDIKAALGKIDIEAMQSITLKVGQSTIVVDQMGVTIKGMMFKLDFQLMAELKALMLQEKGTAMTTVEGGIVMIN